MFSCCVAQVNGKCVIYGTCDDVKNVPCYVDHELPQKWACQLISEYNFIAETCCNTTQLISMDENIAMAAGLLKRCPSCLKNLVSHICGYICSPNQSDFVDVTHHNSTTGARWRFSGVIEADVYLNQDYMYGTFNSCSQVMVPSTGNLAFDVSCGNWDSNTCTPARQVLN
ncbi:hypothetical protein J437_LFUL004894 [Ladona fulva]|uniref:Niemann-Pick C1 N-terminal domain-containing protein n=1 Tax=Ladona fulva TaxID=123851 RepID=A0A8K0JYA7_LADFU|nr:hypothetical protein J437_LFUL004894 [Ladona fulva]